MGNSFQICCERKLTYLFLFDDSGRGNRSIRFLRKKISIKSKLASKCQKFNSLSKFKRTKHRNLTLLKLVMIFGVIEGNDTKGLIGLKTSVYTTKNDLAQQFKIVSMKDF